MKEDTIHDKRPLDFSEMIHLKSIYERDKGTINVGVEIGQSTYLWAIRYAITNKSEVFKKYRWQIIHCPEGMNFPTSDDPVALATEHPDQTYLLRGDWFTKGGIIFMPISPKLLIYTRIGSRQKATELDYSRPAAQRFINAIIPRI